MGSTSSQPESQPSAEFQPPDVWKPIPLCGTLPTLVVPAERYVEQLWAMLDKTLLHSKCGIGSEPLLKLVAPHGSLTSSLGGCSPRVRATLHRTLLRSFCPRAPYRYEPCQTPLARSGKAPLGDSFITTTGADAPAAQHR